MPRSARSCRRWAYPTPMCYLTTLAPMRWPMRLTRSYPSPMRNMGAMSLRRYVRYRAMVPASTPVK